MPSAQSPPNKHTKTPSQCRACVCVTPEGSQPILTVSLFRLAWTQSLSSLPLAFDGVT